MVRRYETGREVNTGSKVKGCSGKPNSVKLTQICYLARRCRNMLVRFNVRFFFRNFWKNLAIMWSVDLLRD